jgi:hypothetical protein
MKFKDLLKPVGKIKVSKIFVNKANNQLTVIIPRKKLKGGIPSRIEISYWN